MEIFVQAAGYLGDLMLLHDVATSTWSCSFRLVGALEIFLVFCSGRRIQPPTLKNLNFRQRTHGLASGEGRGGMHQEDVLRSGLVWVEIGGMRFFKFLKRGVVENHGA